MEITDITVHQNWDESKNQRIVIIYGDSLNDGINKNGEMEIISSSNKDFSYYHAIYLKEHAKTNYTNDAQYQNGIKNMSNTLNIFVPVFIQNNRYNNIVFTDTSEDESQEKYGVLYFPFNSPSEEQYNTLRTLTEKLKYFNEILICGQTYITEDRMKDSKITFKIKGNELEILEAEIKKRYEENSKIRSK